MPEKARLLEQLNEGKFNVPDFVHLSAADFAAEDFQDLKVFLEKHQESFKVIARSCHPKEEFYKGGTFDSLETYADLAGIQYARKRIINFAKKNNQLSILRQQLFNHAPKIEANEMGILLMPFIEGTSVMAKMIGDHWEFGYCSDKTHGVQSEPYITQAPHDAALLDLSKDIQKYLGFKCEIEYIIAADGEIYVVQAKDISEIEILEQHESERAIELDSIRRIRKRRNYRERTIYVMDNKAFYIDLISKYEEFIQSSEDPGTYIDNLLEMITDYESELESFALKHERFAVLGLHIEIPTNLRQMANHYFTETPELQQQLFNALNENTYKIDYLLSEADTLIAKSNVNIKLGTHDAYGIDSVRNPLWKVAWNTDRNEELVKEFKRLGFKTGDTIGIEIGSDDKPTVYRL